MKLYIPFPDINTIGGPQTFMRNLKTWMDQQGIDYQISLKKGSSVFFPISYNIRELKKIKRNGGKVIQRLDGLYYKTKHQKEYKNKNSAISDIYENFADHVIFQSEYSKKQCFAMLGEKDQDQYSIILNGVNTDIFYSEECNSKSDMIKFITTGNFRNLDMLEPVILALDKIVGDFEFSFRIVGPVNNDSLNDILNRDYIIYDEGGDSECIASALRAADVFIYSHLNPPCPNSVLEAIASGLPVVGFDSGSMSELCHFSTDLLAHVSNDIFQRYEDFKPELLKEKIVFCINNFNRFKEQAQRHSKDYSYDKCGIEYFNVFNKVINEGDILNSKWKKRRLNKLLDFILRLPGKIIQDPRMCKLIIKSQTGKETSFIMTLIEKACINKTPNESLLYLFELEKRIYKKVGLESKKFSAGEHSKHRHLMYHEWFIANIEPDKKIIDIGCGTGALAKDIASNIAGIDLLAIDIVENNISIAKAQNSNDAITYLCGDALTDIQNEDYDIVILSNVLEHIEKRVEFLQAINKNLKPSKYLFRVPSYERDWRVPLMNEIGFDYRLDSTHFIEYTFDIFKEELIKAGLTIENAEFKWGEIWAVAKPE